MNWWRGEGPCNRGFTTEIHSDSNTFGKRLFITIAWQVYSLLLVRDGTKRSILRIQGLKQETVVRVDVVLLLFPLFNS